MDEQEKRIKRMVVEKWKKEWESHEANRCVCEVADHKRNNCERREEDKPVIRRNWLERKWQRTKRRNRRGKGKTRNRKSWKRLNKWHWNRNKFMMWTRNWFNREARKLIEDSRKAHFV